MDQDTEEVREKNQRKYCKCRSTKTNVLILMIVVLNIAISGCLVIGYLHQRHEVQEARRASAKAIDVCMRHIALINAKLNTDEVSKNRRNNKFARQYNTRKLSPGNTKENKQLQNESIQETIANRTQKSCPYRSRKRRKLCSFIAKEVSRQLNLTALRQEITKVLATKDQSYFNILGIHQSSLNDASMRKEVNCQDRRSSFRLLLNYQRYRNDQSVWEDMYRHCKNIRDMYTIKWCGDLRKCKRHTNKKPIEVRQCRIIRSTNVGQLSSSTSHVEVRVAGIYFLYCQLTFDVNDSNVAHLISKVSILSSKRSGVHNHKEYLELISQVPVLTKQGKRPVVTVSMFTQAYLYKHSTISVTVSLKDNAKIPRDSKTLRLPTINDITRPYNVFGMHLLESKEDGY